MKATVGPYVVTRKLAEGGMARLFIGYREGIDGFRRQVVLKTVLPEHARDEEFVRCFLNEARLAARLSHPNVIQVLDLGRSEQGLLYIAMELVDGADLSQVLNVLRRQRMVMPQEVAMRIMLDVLAGLDHAHEARDENGQPLGLVHRDATPSNIIVSFSGVAKVVDFGIAKATTKGEDKTRVGVIKGKLAYMAPEQVTGRDIDRRLDIFSCGVILYELLTGARPFDAVNDYESMQRIMGHGPPEDMSVVPEVYQPIVARALARQAAARYATCRDMANDIEAVVKQSGLFTTPSAVAQFLEPWKQRKRAREAKGEEADIPSLLTQTNEIIEIEDVEKTESNFALTRTFVNTLKQHPLSATLGAIVAVAAVIGVLGRQQLAVGLAVEPNVASTALAATPAASAPAAQAVAAMATKETQAQAPVSGNDKEPAIDTPTARVRDGDKGKPTRDPNERPSVKKKRVAAVASTDAEEAEDDAAEKSGPGTVRVSARPWAIVTIDGKAAGETPLAIKLPPGQHHVELVNGDLSSRFERKVTVRSGAETFIDLDMTK